METLKVEWRPFGARLILRKIQEYQGMIIVAPQSKDASMVCEVVASGTTEADYKVGERVLIGRYSGYNVPVMDRAYNDCIIVNESDILCTDANSNEEQ